MNVTEAQQNFAELVTKVYSEGIEVDLEQDGKVIARLTPVTPTSPISVGDLETFLRSLPSLGDDAEAFYQDVQSIRRDYPMETNPWD